MTEFVLAAWLLLGLLEARRVPWRERWYLVNWLPLPEPDAAGAPRARSLNRTVATLLVLAVVVLCWPLYARLRRIAGSDARPH